MAFASATSVSLRLAQAQRVAGHGDGRQRHRQRGDQRRDVAQPWPAAPRRRCSRWRWRSSRSAMRCAARATLEHLDDRAPAARPGTRRRMPFWLTSAAVDGESEACAAASAGASLSPSPTISTLRPSAFSASSRAILPSGRTSLAHSAMPAARAAARTACLAVARQKIDAVAGAAQRRNDRCRIGAQRIFETRSATGAASPSRIPERRRRRASRAAPVTQRRRAEAPLAARTARQQGRCPACSTTPSAARDGKAALARGAHHGLRVGMAAGDGERRRRAQASHRRSRRRSPAMARRASACRSCRTRSVSTSDRRSRPSAALTMTPLANRRLGRRHLHGGHGQRQRAGAGDDEHGDGVGQRLLEAGARRCSQPSSVAAPRICTAGA